MSAEGRQAVSEMYARILAERNPGTVWTPLGKGDDHTCRDGEVIAWLGGPAYAPGPADEDQRANAEGATR